MPGTVSGGSHSEFEQLETLPEAGGMQQPVKSQPSAPSAIRADNLEELSAVQPADESELPAWNESAEASTPTVHVSVHTIRDLLDLLKTGLPTVAAEGGIYRVQRHAFGGPPGRDSGLRRLAAAVIGGPAPEGPLDHGRLPQLLPDGEPLRMLTCGVDLDVMQAGSEVADEASEPFRAALNSLCRMTDALGAALLLRDRSGGYRPRQVTGILRCSAERLTFASGDPVTARYLARRVALIAAGSLRLLGGIESHFVGPARTRIGRIAFLPAWADGRPAYLLLTAMDGVGPWDVHSITLQLGLVPAAGPPPP